MIRVLIADDHTLFREGVSAMLQATSDTELVGEAGTGADALAQALALRPDIVLMDIMMPELNGILATERLVAAQPGVGVIMLTMLEDDDSLFAAMCAGARGYILKGADKAEMLQTIRAVANGEARFGPAIAGRLMGLFRQQRAARERPFPNLSEREFEVLELVARGLSNGQIADRLLISGKTVSNHISNIFLKLHVSDRAQAIVRAHQAGLT
ncbi:response regulator transcription factor [Candidatus Chloroploca sp. Khr17]|uniref:response regulator n=1 Tax=Candidatus Chloroploca sp. Khr17 TaxID=2496869 RepID=UPI00101DE36E|nr:response regulator transcription factor [Candidatus Chloroploca sp. Khr17]